MSWKSAAQRIAAGLANAEKIKAELTRTEAARLEILNKANAQANKLIEEARAAAARVQEVETQKAIAAAADIVTKAKQAAEAEHARMLADLKREVGRLVVDTTSKVTGKILPWTTRNVWPKKPTNNWRHKKVAGEVTRL